jgi:hypothetical protein
MFSDYKKFSESIEFLKLYNIKCRKYSLFNHSLSNSLNNLENLYQHQMQYHIIKIMELI